MLEKRRIFLLVICFAALCLSAAPAMADFVELNAGYTLMTVTDTSTLFDGTTATATIIAASTIKMNLKDSDLILLQPEIDVDSIALNATLDFAGSGIDYTAIGSLEMSDIDGMKIASDFESTTIDYDFYTSIGDMDFYNLTVTGKLTPQPGNTSILLGEVDNSWEFKGKDGGTISLSNADDFDHGIMVVFESFIMGFATLQDFIKANANASGSLRAQIHSTPIPAAVLLGIIGLGVVGLKLRKYA